MATSRVTGIEIPGQHKRGSNTAGEMLGNGSLPNRKWEFESLHSSQQFRDSLLVAYHILSYVDTWEMP